MSQSLSKIILHIIFSTKNRYPFLNKKIRHEMHQYLALMCKNFGCFPHKINGTSDHVHIVCELSRTITACKLIEEIKTSSSKWIKTKGSIYQKFHWQKGYGVFSIGMSQLQTVVHYIEKQEELHGKKTYQEEFIGFLKKYQIEYDERYVWD
ncbi:IS200/IS605 family transposase [Calditrichota bacterium GD2]